MSSPVFVFDAYGTLFDVHACIARYAAEAGPDGQRMSEIWRAKQLEYTWTLTLAGQYVGFWTLTERALDFAFASVPSVDPALRGALLEAYFALDAFPDARETGMSSVDLGAKLLQEARVAVTPGIAFGQSGEGHFRISFATADDLLEESVQRIGDALGWR